MLLAISSYSAVQDNFLHFTDIDGLPRNITTCLEQDSYGYLWVGTPNGIVRYDGNSFSTFHQLKEININSLCIDSKNNLWVGTNNGLYKYNRAINSFELISNGYIQQIREDHEEIYFINIGKLFKVTVSGITEIISDASLSAFCLTSEGIWYSCNNEGIKFISRKSNFHEIIEQQLTGQQVWVISQIDGNLFLGCRDGELFVRSADGSMKSIGIDNHHHIKEIVKVKDEIWVATDGNGIVVLDANFKYSRTITRNQNMVQSINSNSIYDILPGNNGKIWIASYGAGLTCIFPDNLLFQNLLPETGNNNSLVANEGTAVFERDGNFYLGTNYGLSIWNEQHNQYSNFSAQRLKKELKGTKILGVCTDQDNSVWIGTYDGLLGKYNASFQLIKTFNPGGNATAEMQQIMLMYNYRSQNILIGTHRQDRSLLNLDIKTQSITPFELQTNDIKTKNFNINSIRENQQKELIVSVLNQGLFKVNVKACVLENSFPGLNKRINFPSTDFYQDKDGYYWITSATQGLIRISSEGTQFDQWTEKDGLPTNSLLRIESVEDRYLWISTIAGVCRFDRETKQIMSFNHRDGLAANEFNNFVSAKTTDGRIIFGSVAGFTIINPTKVNPDTSKTEIIISDITFQNQSIRSPEAKPLLKKPLEETKEIYLPYNKSSFSIYFFARDKSFLKYPNYAYRLIGLEKNWTFIGETNHTNYTNLSPGTYTFEIKSADKSLEESHPTRLVIHIQSPWYLSWYAYLAYAALFFTLLYLSVYAWLKRIELKKEKEISEFKIQKEHELTEKKLAFFTNISHDLKTPLTLIDAPVSDLLLSRNLDPEQMNQLRVISRNSKRLYKLITDLLDFRKIAQNQYVLELEQISISLLVEELCLAFKEECKIKSIDFQWQVNHDLNCLVDVKKLEKILWNLLSNALKFTNRGGSIHLLAEEKFKEGSKQLKISISDNGIGISENDQKKVFDRFFQIRNSKTMQPEGSGIGLSIVQELVEMHHGQITLQSALGKGTTFTISIPSNQEMYSQEDQALIKKTYAESAVKTNVPADESIPEPSIKSKQYNLPSLLIVEDNKELRDYLTDHFSKTYKVFHAADGGEGLKKAVDECPEMILTDVQMPTMNGYEFCKEIRRNFVTSHIPVVMLTANSTIEQQIEGLTTGADAYLTKPFDIKLLDTTLKTVLENRQKLRLKFMGVESSENLEKIIPQKDVDFIQKLKSFIEENIASEHLNVDLLSEHFAVSSSKLNRKIKSLLDATPSNLIKTIRLKKAYELLQMKDARVSEVAFQTGFTDPNYFTYCFKKEFGQNPSQIRVD